MERDLHEELANFLTSDINNKVLTSGFIKDAKIRQTVDVMHSHILDVWDGPNK